MPGEDEVLEGNGEGAVEGAGTGAGEGENITISKEVYESLLAAVTENSDATKKILSKVEEEEAAAVAEREANERKAKGGRYSKVQNAEEFAALLREDLMEELHTTFIQTAIQPLANTVMSIVVAQELKDVRGAHDDFDNYKDEVYKLVKENTKLTLEDGYLIASGKKAKPKESVKAAGEGAVPKGPKSGGEKPGARAGAFEPAGYKTTKDAAIAAAEKIYGKSSK